MPSFETLSVQDLQQSDPQPPRLPSGNNNKRSSGFMSRRWGAVGAIALVGTLSVLSVVAVAVALPSTGQQGQQGQQQAVEPAAAAQHPQAVAGAVLQTKKKVVDDTESETKDTVKTVAKEVPKKPSAGRKPYSGPLSTRSVDGNLICETPECSIAAALIVSALNVSADPCEDFYEFACGGWIANHPAPPPQGTFDQVGDLVNDRLHLIIESPAAPSDPEPLHMFRRAYQACMDTATMDTVGLAPLWAALQSQGGWPMVDDKWDGSSFTTEGSVASIRRLFFAPMLAVGIDADLVNTSRRILYIGEGQTGIREDILAHPHLNVEVMAAYTQFITDSAKQLRDFLGSSTTDEQIAQEADALITFETEMAKLMEASGTSDVTEMFKLMGVKELQATADVVTAGGLDYLTLLRLMFSSTGVVIAEDEPLYLTEGVEYVQGLNTLLAATDPRTLANFFGWMWVLDIGSETTYAMNNISDTFVAVYAGVNTMTRDTFCYIQVNANMAMPVSRAYVDEFFPAGAKIENEQMVADLKDSFNVILDGNSFLTPEDTVTAKEKLAAIDEFVAYPDWIMDDASLTTAYEGLDITVDTQFQNLINIGTYFNYWICESYRTPPRSRFVMPPTMVNAFYNPTANSITILAGILQNPFYQHNSLAALNYGGIGMVIGHELTHGFDNSGRLFDKDGNLASWWSQESIAAFNERAQCFVDQYNDFHPPEVADPTVHVNGQNTLGENIADNGGIREAFYAYQVYVNRSGEEPRLPGLDEYSPDQLFYLGQANLWCESNTEESILSQLKADPHSPGRFRVLGPDSNDAEFSRVWNCPADSTMNRDDQSCLLW